MCELLGISFKKPINPKYIISEFSKRSNCNPHGWGLAYSNQDQLIITKSIYQMNKCMLAKELIEKSPIISNSIMIHARYKTNGKNTLKDTHPFMFEFQQNQFAYAQNGGLHEIYDDLSVSERRQLYKDFANDSYTPQGDNDSELIFSYIMHRLKQMNLTVNSKNSFIILKDILLEINKKIDFNCILSTKDYLFIFKSKTGNKSLSCAHFDNMEEINNSYLKNVKALFNNFMRNRDSVDDSNPGVIIASVPFLNGKWQKIDNASLSVFKEGLLIYQL